MDFTDERIALLEREFRRQKREEEERQKKETETQEEIKTLNFEEILEGVRAKKVVFPDQESFEFEVREYFDDGIPMVKFKHFFNAAEEKEGVAIYLNHDRGVSQMITAADKPNREESMDAWKKRMEAGMKVVGTYAKVEKQSKLNHVDYLSYRTPTKKGWVFNLVFRIHYGSNRVVGNYNCYERDKDRLGLILEALLYHMDELLVKKKEEKEGEGVIGETGNNL